MYFDDLASFWHMGGYALYVWLSFAVAMFSLAGIWLQAWLHKKALLKHVLHEQARLARIKAAQKNTNQASKNGELG